MTRRAGKTALAERLIQDRQPRAREAKTRAVRIARISDSSEGIISCSCGWAKAHPREKVRGDAAERHLARKHKGKGFWL